MVNFIIFLKYNNWFAIIGSVANTNTYVNFAVLEETPSMLNQEDSRGVVLYT